jgi:hypothetical protein
MRHHRALPWALLVVAALLWAGNWVASRGIRETMPPAAGACCASIGGSS